MCRKAVFRVLGGALAMLLALTAVAVAAGGRAPTLLSPNHKRVAPGHIGLVTAIPLKPSRHGVFIAISPTRSLDRSGHLKWTCKKCDFTEPKHLKGDKYRYVAPFNFPGYWAVTPGKYYWQAHYFTVGDTAVYWSNIGSFVVK